MYDPNALRSRLIESGLANFADRLTELAQPCLSIHTTAVSDDGVPVGASKFGGNPDLPATFDWPVWRDCPLAFLGQINLSTIARNPIASPLPTEGLLSFFYDAEQSTWGFDPQDRGSWSVHLFHQHDLQRTVPPESLPKQARYAACQLAFDDGITLPGWETPVIQALNLTDDEQDRYLDVLDTEEPHGHHLLGHPQEVQAPMQLECQLASNGVYCGDADGYASPQARELEDGASDWLLLLQIDSDDNPGWMWGDCGCLCFWITQRDLQSQRFERAWMILQCS